MKNQELITLGVLTLVSLVIIYFVFFYQNNKEGFLADTTTTGATTTTENLGYYCDIHKNQENCIRQCVDGKDCMVNTDYQLCKWSGGSCSENSRECLEYDANNINLSLDELTKKCNSKTFRDKPACKYTQEYDFTNKTANSGVYNCLDIKYPDSYTGSKCRDIANNEACDNTEGRCKYINTDPGEYCVPQAFEGYKQVYYKSVGTNGSNSTNGATTTTNGATTTTNGATTTTNGATTTTNGATTTTNGATTTTNGATKTTNGATTTTNGATTTTNGATTTTNAATTTTTGSIRNSNNATRTTNGATTTTNGVTTTTNAATTTTTGSIRNSNNATTTTTGSIRNSNNENKKFTEDGYYNSTVNILKHMPDDYSGVVAIQSDYEGVGNIYIPMVRIS